MKAAKEKQHPANKRKNNLYHSGFLIRNCRHQKGVAPYYSSVERKDLSSQNPAEISFRTEWEIKTFSDEGHWENLSLADLSKTNGWKKFSKQKENDRRRNPETLGRKNIGRTKLGAKYNSPSALLVFKIMFAGGSKNYNIIWCGPKCIWRKYTRQFYYK